MKNETKNNKNNLPEFLKEYPFSVPENYFEEFPGKLQNKINKEKRKKSASFTLSLKIAASIIIIAVSAFVFTIISNYADNHKQTENIEFDQIADIDNIDEHTIIDIIIEEPNNTTGIDDNEIIEYLAYNTNYSTIIEEY